MLAFISPDTLVLVRREDGTQYASYVIKTEGDLVYLTEGDPAIPVHLSLVRIYQINAWHIARWIFLDGDEDTIWDTFMTQPRDVIERQIFNEMKLHIKLLTKKLGVKYLNINLHDPRRVANEVYDHLAKMIKGAIVRRPKTYPQ